MSDIEHGGKPRVYVSAFFCESVVREKNDLLTAIRINEGYIVRPLRITPQLPDGTPDLRNRSLIFQPLRISAVVKFCSEEPTEFMFRLNGTRPSGKPLTSSAKPTRIQIGKGPEGHTFNTNVNLRTLEEGDYWFDFYVDDLLATKLAIRVKFETPIECPEPIPEYASDQALESH